MATATAKAESGKQRTVALGTMVEGDQPEEQIVYQQQLGEDGYPYRIWPVGGNRGPRHRFSLRPYDDHERPIYWNPVTRDGHMWWRDWQPGPDHIYRIVAKHRWVMPYPGSFSPRNAWEDFMTREWMETALAAEYGGTINPDQWKGFDHPENEPGAPPHMWACECSWQSGNMRAMKAHQTKHGSGHRLLLSL